MDKDIWQKTHFTKTNLPDWPCPNCNKSILKLDKFKFDETALSKSWHSDEDWSPEFMNYTFAGSLTCPLCTEFVAFLGDGREEHYQYYDDYTGDYMEQNDSVFEPKYFHPALNLFRINDKCPKDVQSVILDSFTHFWNDLPSCANKIRVSLELLMNHFKIKKTTITVKKKRVNLKLHQRLEEFKIKNPETGDILLAIKWIGNTGSHIGILERSDILETYELLEYAINKLFDDTEHKLLKLTKEINKRKGVIKRK